jgi:hypothetical protein
LISLPGVDFKAKEKNKNLCKFKDGECRSAVFVERCSDRSVDLSVETSVGETQQQAARYRNNSTKTETKMN